MQVKLLEHTPYPQAIVYAAARQCYSTDVASNFYMTVDSTMEEVLIRKVISMGHTSVLEHVSFTFSIEGISRACSHQLVRFRHASYSQQSQRYCTVTEQFPYVTPPTISKRFKPEFNAAIKNIAGLYEMMVNAGIPAEDARYLLPNACCTHIVMTMNARELHHAFSLRCCIHAQWEIRDLFNRIKNICKDVAPVIFENAGAPCETKGSCPEGPRSCGRI